MGISFKLAKKGARYQPKSSVVVDKSDEKEERLGDFEGSKREGDGANVANEVTCMTGPSACFGGLEFSGLEECDISFTVNLFQKGYFIGKPSETENLQPLLQDDGPLHPYDRASETLFSAIQSGCLPGDILDDIPSKYINGTLVCEVRDYRKCLPGQRTNTATADDPIVNRVRLRMSLENVVKDIPLLSDDSWTYSDLMEVEARIVKALQPQLLLDPTPKLERLFADPCPNKFNLGIARKRPWQTPEVTVTSNSQTHGKKICIEGVPSLDTSKQRDPGTALCNNSSMQAMPENPLTQHVSGGIQSTRPNNFTQETARLSLPLQSQTKFQPSTFQGIVQDRGAASPANFSSASPNISSPQGFMGSYSDSISNAALLGKRENQDTQMAPASGVKRVKHTQGSVDNIQPQPLGSQFVGPNAQDGNWKNKLRSQFDANGIQYSSGSGGQRFPQSNQEAGTSFYFNQQGMRYIPKEEQIDTENMERQELERSKSSLHAFDQQQTRPQHLMQRNHLPPITQWHHSRPLVDKDMRKDEAVQKRKGLTSPRVSSGPIVQSPVSSKSGEISSGSVGQFSGVAMPSALASQKPTTNSNAMAGAPSATSSPNDSMHRQAQVSAAAKQKSKSANKTPIMSGVASPASVSTMNPPLNASSPSIGTAPIGDQFERFAKIEMVTQRHRLNVKKTKVDNYPAKKSLGGLDQHVAAHLNASYKADDFTDETKPLSRSLVGGNINICKYREMIFTRKDGEQAINRRFTMAEKPHFDGDGGTVFIEYGDGDPNKFTPEWLLTLPTTNYADLLAAQFCALIEHDGYRKTGDQIQTLSSYIASSPGALTTVSGIPSDDAPADMKHPEAAPGSLSNVPLQPNNTNMGSHNPSQNLSGNARILASGGNSPGLPVAQGYYHGTTGMPPRAQQLDQPLLQQQQQIHHQQQQQIQQQQIQQQQQQQQQQLPQIQRSSSMLSANPLSQLMGQNSNLPMIGGNKPNAHLQLQMLQQQQQQNSTQRRMLLNAMGNLGGNSNNMVGLSGLNGMMNIGNRPVTGLGNMRPNQMNLGLVSPNFSTGLRAPFTPDQAVAVTEKYKHMQQNRIAGMYGQAGMLPNSGGMPVLSHVMRAGMGQVQRNPMGPPKVPGPNFFVNQQHFQLQQQQQQQQQLQLQQQQISSPMQSSQAGSPSMVIQNQTAMSPQLSSGALQQQMNSNNNNMGGGNVGAGPASPQLSSQTHGSVGSITSSPMEQLQGSNK